GPRHHVGLAQPHPAQLRGLALDRVEVARERRALGVVHDAGAGVPEALAAAAARVVDAVGREVLLRAAEDVAELVGDVDRVGLAPAGHARRAAEPGAAALVGADRVGGDRVVGVGGVAHPLDLDVDRVDLLGAVVGGVDLEAELARPLAADRAAPLALG